MTTEVGTTEITMDQFNETKGQSRGGRGASPEVAKVRKLKVGTGVQFPASTFYAGEDGKFDPEGKFSDKLRVRMANRISSDSSKNEYHIKVKRADDNSLLVMRITKAQSQPSND